MMSSFFSDKKRENEMMAGHCLSENDFAGASIAFARAAECSIAMANLGGGLVAMCFHDDARELLDLAEKSREKAKIQPRARKVVMQDYEESFETHFQLKEKPTEKLDDVAGLDDVKTELRERAIDPFIHPELYDRFKLNPGGGVLMFGPRGCGKTSIARAVAGEVDATFFSVNAADIRDKYVGETEKNLQRLFEAAHAHPRAVIFIDEVDHLLGRRGNRKIGSVSQFLGLTDGIVRNKNCLLLLAGTNKPWALDEAVVRPGRLGTHIYVGLPDAAARESILSYNLRGVPSNPLNFESLASMGDGYSGADLTEWCNLAKRSAKNRQMSSGCAEAVSMEDFVLVFAGLRPSVTSHELKSFENWRNAGRKPTPTDDPDSNA